MVHGIPQNEHGVDGGLSHLSAGADDCSVVLLNELQQLFLLWVWIESDESILKRDNLEVFFAEVQNVLLASLQLPCPRLELFGSQILLFASFLDGSQFLSPLA